MKTLLIVNQYKNPNTAKVTTQCHIMNSDFEITKTYPKMDGDDISLFNGMYDKVMFIDVQRHALLDKIDIV